MRRRNSSCFPPDFLHLHTFFLILNSHATSVLLHSTVHNDSFLVLSARKFDTVKVSRTASLRLEDQYMPYLCEGSPDMVPVGAHALRSVLHVFICRVRTRGGRLHHSWPS